MHTGPLRVKVSISIPHPTRPEPFRDQPTSFPQPLHRWLIDFHKHASEPSGQQGCVERNSDALRQVLDTTRSASACGEPPHVGTTIGCVR
jgi:hypothetical protein